MWQQVSYAMDQLWNWVTYEASVHPLIFAGIAVIIVAAWVLYKAEVRTK